MLYLLFLPYIFFGIYIGIVAVLSCYIVFLLFKILTTAQHRGARGWWLVFSLVPFVYLTWPFFVGRIIFEIQCSSVAGLHTTHPINASRTGYFLYNSKIKSTNVSHVSYHPYAHQAVWDLISGRISFFEFADKKIFLADKRSRDCADSTLRDLILRELRPPEGKCLAVAQSNGIESKYEVHGYENDRPEDVKILDRVAGGKVASYRIVSLTENRPTLRRAETMYCPVDEPNSNSPIQAITAATFLDPEGKVMSETDFRDLKHIVKTGYIQEFPPRQANKEQQRLASAQCTYPEFGPDVEIHKVHLYQGGRPVDVRIDNSTHTVREVSVILNNPNKRTILNLSANDPVIWKISRTPNSILTGVIATGRHGTAVIGIDRATPLAISTRHHNPAVNCNSSDMGKIYSSLRDGDTREQKVHNVETVVIGQSDYQESSLIFSRERSLVDYLVY